MRNWRWFIAVLSLVALMGVACGGGEDDTTDTGSGGGDTEVEEFPADTTMGKLQEAGEIKVGVKYDVPLFGFKNPQTGEVEGFDVDMAQHIADTLGVELKLVEAISDNRIPYLQDGTVDLVFSTMTITTDRDAEIDFSRPYFIAHGKVLVPEGSDVQSIGDLGSGTTTCTALDSTYETTVIPEQAPDTKIKGLGTYSECFAQLQQGKVDALVTDNVILAGFRQQDPSMQIVGDDLTTDPYGAGVKDGDTEFAEFLSAEIEEMVESGEWQDLYDKWIGEYTGEEAENPVDWGTLEDALENYPCVETC